jgi:hypothetical protein
MAKFCSRLRVVTPRTTRFQVVKVFQRFFEGLQFWRSFRHTRSHRGGSPGGLQKTQTLIDPAEAATIGPVMR